jgi:hypothetical protein
MWRNKKPRPNCRPRRRGQKLRSTIVVVALALLLHILVFVLLRAILALLLTALAAEIALSVHLLLPRAARVLPGIGTLGILAILLGTVDAILLALIIVELAESRLAAELAVLALILVELAHLEVLSVETVGDTAPPLAEKDNLFSNIGFLVPALKSVRRAGALISIAQAGGPHINPASWGPSYQSRKRA